MLRPQPGFHCRFPSVIDFNSPLLTLLLGISPGDLWCDFFFFFEEERVAVS